MQTNTLFLFYFLSNIAQKRLHISSVPHCAWENQLTCLDLKVIDVFPVKLTDLLKTQISHLAYMF